MMQQSRYWFPAKRYGWGWGIPSAWQGWVILVGFVALMALNGYVFPPTHDLLPFIALAVVLVVALLAICFAKGEPPRWRWGK
jgi:peptidoglycan/LPS O-acetylase OafA/YrhL